MERQTVRKPLQSPPRLDISPEYVLSETRQLINGSRKLQDEISVLQPEEATFENVLLPLIHNENKNSDSFQIFCFLRLVSPQEELRDASNEAQKLINTSTTESLARADIFRLVDAIFQKGEELDMESQHFLQKRRSQYLDNGLGISDCGRRSRLIQIRKDLASLVATAQRNLNENNSGLWFTLQELEGIPEAVLSGLAKGHGENEGKVWLTFKKPHLNACLRHAVQSSTRKRMFLENERRCPENVELLQKIILLRHEAASLLGYPNHAAFKLKDTMAATEETVSTFLERLQQKLTQQATKEIESLAEMKYGHQKPSGDQTGSISGIISSMTTLLRKNCSTMTNSRCLNISSLKTPCRGSCRSSRRC
ncbi:hypothetical protein VTN77DRAFT_5038 [Rasamsonia byssochlamydoides]|uniref:uncharacterized protein n=1 Tax=Rasamsonia byssochlamydoides TaxID=89139 RepID=UPI0037431A14